MGFTFCVLGFLFLGMCLKFNDCNLITHLGIHVVAVALDVVLVPEVGQKSKQNKRSKKKKNQQQNTENTHVFRLLMIYFRSLHLATDLIFVLVF